MVTSAEYEMQYLHAPDHKLQFDQYSVKVPPRKLPAYVCTLSFWTKAVQLDSRWIGMPQSPRRDSYFLWHETHSCDLNSHWSKFSHQGVNEYMTPQIRPRLIGSLKKRWTREKSIYAYPMQKSGNHTQHNSVGESFKALPRSAAGSLKLSARPGPWVADFWRCPDGLASRDWGGPRVPVWLFWGGFYVKKLVYTGFATSEA